MNTPKCCVTGHEKSHMSSNHLMGAVTISKTQVYWASLVQAHGRCSGFYLHYRGLCIGKNLPWVFLKTELRFSLRAIKAILRKHSLKSPSGANLCYHIHTNTQEYGNQRQLMLVKEYWESVCELRMQKGEKLKWKKKHCIEHNTVYVWGTFLISFLIHCQYGCSLTLI